MGVQDSIARIWHLIYDGQGPFGLSEDFLGNVVSDFLMFLVFTALLGWALKIYEDRRDWRNRLPERARRASELYSRFATILLFSKDMFDRAQVMLSKDSPLKSAYQRTNMQDEIAKIVEDECKAMLDWFRFNYSVYPPEWFEEIEKLEQAARELYASTDSAKRMAHQLIESSQEPVKLLMFTGNERDGETANMFIERANKFDESFKVAFGKIDKAMHKPKESPLEHLDLEKRHAWMMRQVKVRQTAVKIHMDKLKKAEQTGQPPPKIVVPEDDDEISE